MDNHFLIPLSRSEMDELLQHRGGVLELVPREDEEQMVVLYNTREENIPEDQQPFFY